MKTISALIFLVVVGLSATAHADIIYDGIPPRPRYGPRDIPRPLRRPPAEQPLPVQTPPPAPQKDGIDEIIDDAEKDAGLAGLVPALGLFALGATAAVVAASRREKVRAA